MLVPWRVSLGPDPLNPRQSLVKDAMTYNSCIYALSQGTDDVGISIERFYKEHRPYVVKIIKV